MQTAAAARKTPRSVPSPSGGGAPVPDALARCPCHACCGAASTDFFRFTNLPKAWTGLRREIQEVRRVKGWGPLAESSCGAGSEGPGEGSWGEGWAYSGRSGFVSISGGSGAGALGRSSGVDGADGAGQSWRGVRSMTGADRWRCNGENGSCGECKRNVGSVFGRSSGDEGSEASRPCGVAKEVAGAVCCRCSGVDGSELPARK